MKLYLKKNQNESVDLEQFRTLGFLRTNYKVGT